MYAYTSVVSRLCFVLSFPLLCRATVAPTLPPFARSQCNKKQNRNSNMIKCAPAVTGIRAGVQSCAKRLNERGEGSGPTAQYRCRQRQ